MKFNKTPHILIVEARFYEEISNHLLESTIAELEKYGATYEIVTVPGALEIPAAIRFASLSRGTKNGGKIFDAFIALGCVIRGETTHYETVCNESSRGIMDLSINRALPIANGILTCENKEQALDRARKDKKDKGSSFARAALQMLALKQSFVY